METVGWNPLLDERSQPSSFFSRFRGPIHSATSTTQPIGHQRVAPPQSANYPNRNSVRFSFNLPELNTGCQEDMDSLLALPSPAISVSPGVFFDDPFSFSVPQVSANAAVASSNSSNSSNPEQRSPSLGIGSSLAGDLNEDLTNARPSSVAQTQFSNSTEWSSQDSFRPRSAVPALQRPGSSAEWRDDDDSFEGADDLEHWKDWNIRTTPSCPALDQLFENKRRWREKFNQSVPPPLQRHCVFCKSINKPQSVYLSHAIRDAQGEITCPVLNAYSCPKCGKRGHTIRYCAIHQSRQSGSSGTKSGMSNRLSSVGSMSDAITMGVRSTKSSLGFY